MDKVENSLTHSISVNDRKNLVISGVKKIESFDSEEFLLETVMGFLIVKGDNLEIVRLDTYQGNVTIKGRFSNLAYIEEVGGKTKEEGVFNRLFKWWNWWYK
mgnify:CR=1 FL=1